MNQTSQTLLEQMRITDFDIEQRKTLLSMTTEDCKLLSLASSPIQTRLDELVDRFYELQTDTPEIALLIGDADTLQRLRHAQRRYVIDLFSGVYDLEYVNNRLRIGLVHKRIGVEPKLYLAAIHTLKHLLALLLSEVINDKERCKATQQALEKLILFDITLVFETYIRSLVSEIEASKDKSEKYAQMLEEKVIVRTRQLEELSRTDPLTNLQNRRYLLEALTGTLRSAQRRKEPVTLVYIDVNDFKLINDNEGHQRGDDVLRILGRVLLKISRAEDSCFRYGGDEFCIILPNCSKQQAEETYIHRLTTEIATELPGITLSIGSVQTGPQEYAQPEALIHEADLSMYAVKNIFKLQQQV